MPAFLLYEIKVAVALAVFYMFYRLLLRKETFHRFNRVVLVGTAVLSFVLPLCIITVHRPMELVQAVESAFTEAEEPVALELAPAVEASAPWWPIALAALFWAGVAFVIIRVGISILSIYRILMGGEVKSREDGCYIIVTDRDIDPFSWMKYIVLSRQDWEEPHESILAHEKAHIAYGHSAELLVVDLLSAFQWFNPAIWMLRADLQELHEYEADDAVLRAGANLKEYQYLLIRKAVSKSGYSVANSFNHSILKNRITMMSKSKSPFARGLRALYVIPLACLGIGLQAQTVYVPQGKGNEKIFTSDGTKALNTLDLTVNADGSVSTEQGTFPLTDLVAYLRDENALGPETAVRLKVQNNAPMGSVEDVMDELRNAGARKVMFFVADQPLVTPMMPFRPMPLSSMESKVDRKNICWARLNENDKIFFDDGAYADDDVIIRHGVAFIEEHGKDARFVMKNTRATSFGAFMHLQNLILQIYDQVRDAKAKAVYGKPMAELTQAEGNEVRRLVPYAVTKAETTR